MKLGIMQPYFFPYLGYFELIHRTDKWVVFDVVRYGDRTWMNRNRILHPTKGWQYITVPVKHTPDTPLIKDTVLVDKAAAHQRIRGQIEHYRAGHAPYFKDVQQLVDETFESCVSDRLCELNVRSMSGVCARLGIPFEPLYCSEATPDLTAVAHAGDWALEISTRLGAAEYINPPGGKELFDPAAFAQKNIKLTFTDMVDFRYPSPGYESVDHLSILDVLMWNSPETVKRYLDSRTS